MKPISLIYSKGLNVVQYTLYKGRTEIFRLVEIIIDAIALPPPAGLLQSRLDERYSDQAAGAANARSSW